MALEIQTNALRQRRQTFGHIARRLGEDRPASRYEEAMFDLQSEANFHYRPTWQSEFEIFDTRKTAIVMADWYDLKDPRQLYYGTYTISRARMMEAVEKNFAFVEKRGLLDTIHPDWQEMIRFYLLPLRHAEWGANMNACDVVDRGYGAAVTQAAMFATMDRLGIAQIISRIGLAMGGPEALDQAREAWMAAAEWQGVRRLVEDSLVVDDWFEQLVLQFLAFDGLLYPLVYDRFDQAGQAHGASGLSMICEFMADWQEESIRWTDAVLKRTAAESEANRGLIAQWCDHWKGRVIEALEPLAIRILGETGPASLAELGDALDARCARLGLADQRTEAA